jgi:predicted Fe-Mo cluster-binding NifX family protein
MEVNSKLEEHVKLCIPTTGDDGVAARVSGHFGRAPYYTFVDTASGSIAAVANPGHHAVHPPDFVLGHGLDALAVRGLGRGAYTRLTAAGVELLVTEEADVESTLRALEEGRLRPLEASDVHAGGHHHPGPAS